MLCCCHSKPKLLILMVQPSRCMQGASIRPELPANDGGCTQSRAPESLAAALPAWKGRSWQATCSLARQHEHMRSGSAQQELSVASRCKHLGCQVAASS